MTIWKRPIDLDRLNATSENTLIDHLKIIYSKVGEDFIEAQCQSVISPTSLWECYMAVLR